MYRKTPFRVAPLEDVEMDLKELYDRGEKITRIYLTNGDPFVLGTDRLVKIAELVHQYLPEVEVLTCYASIQNLKAKSLEDLKLLKSVGYDELYVGLETAYAPAVKLINKGFTVEEAYENIGKLKEAGMKYSALLMLGIGGKGHSEESVEATAAFLNKYPPYRVSPLSTAVLRGSELEELCDKGEYVQLTERELIEEEKMLLRALKINDCIFFGSHPYNLITISGVLPQDREEIIKHLDSEMAAWDRDQPGFLDTVWKRTDM
ncbi:hypothetical protein DORFOR_02530 [Dorea formicigenerans ATCC 27755]|uniref:Radical SAM core domain-containing protein n=2 Tax=Dorea formicigenerans TaxID=39486 RepID=B0G8C5_9FIRM|nr:hypothetical protein DORFOR_02530 [Dorea formicigenerans ATCC 27755]